MELLERIESYLRERHVAATRFGRNALGDPRFVLELRKGRVPRPRTMVRLERYLELAEPAPTLVVTSLPFHARTADRTVRRPRAKARLPHLLLATPGAQSL